MEQRLSLVTLGVADLARATAFYERLGWKRSMAKAEGVAFFQLGGIALALWPRTDLAKDAGVDLGAAPPHAGVSLAQNVRERSDVDRILSEAKTAGATIVKPAHDTFYGGYAGYFADPEGFLWEIAWNPGFTVRDDGSIRVPGGEIRSKIKHPDTHGEEEHLANIVSRIYSTDLHQAKYTATLYLILQAEILARHLCIANTA